MNYTDIFYLRKAGEFANARRESDILPIPYGDLTGIGVGGVWPCPCIDTVNFKYLVAACEIDTTGLVIYNADGGVISAATYTVSTATGDTIIDFASDQGDGLSARGKGKKIGGTLLTNPIAIIEDILSSAGFTAIDSTAFIAAKSLASTLAYKGAGVLLTDRRLDEIVTEICASFLGNAWVTTAGYLTIILDTATTVYNLQGFLAERDFDGGESAEWRTENLINQAECFYAPTYLDSDKRFKEGVNPQFLGYSDGATNQDDASVLRFGVRRPDTPFEFWWIFDATTLTAIQSRIVALYALPVLTFSCAELSYRNINVEPNQYVSFSTELLRDSNGLPLKNQIGKVLSRKISLRTPRIDFVLQDTGQFVSYSPLIFDGTWLFDGGSSFGGVRRRDAMI